MQGLLQSHYVLDVSNRITPPPPDITTETLALYFLVHRRPARTDLLMYYCCSAITATVLLNYAVPRPKLYYSLSYLTDDLFEYK